MTSAPDLNTLFRSARSHNGWTDQVVTDEQLKQLYELIKWGPTSVNCLPARILFVRTQAGKQRLLPYLSEGNITKTMTAPVTAIIGFDTEFHQHLPRLFPHNPAIKDLFSDEAHAELTAFRNGSLQGGYFIVAARALGLDCGPMSGFNGPALDADFWAGSAIKTNFLCNLGYGDATKLFARHPRFEFDEVCKLL